MSRLCCPQAPRPPSPVDILLSIILARDHHFWTCPKRERPISCLGGITGWELLLNHPMMGSELEACGEDGQSLGMEPLRRPQGRVEGRRSRETFNGDLQGGFFPADPVAGVAGVGAAVCPRGWPQVQDTAAAGHLGHSAWAEGLPVLPPGDGVHSALGHLTDNLPAGPSQERAGPELRAGHGLWKGSRDPSTSLRNRITKSFWGERTLS